MERLTSKNEFDEITSYNPITKHVAGDKEIRKKLSQYEDSELSPEEVMNLQAQNRDLIRLVRKIDNSIANGISCMEKADLVNEIESILEKSEKVTE